MNINITIPTIINLILIFVDCARATKDNIKCPAVKFIINRNDSVSGRK